MANKCNCPPPGLPAYMGTFADLMTLLMCFFVLLLSFSEMDVLKYKQVAGSMLNAFGVQNVLEVKDIPKGTSVIALEFRPGRPEPTPIDTMMQQTSELTQTELEFQPGQEDKSGGQQKEAGQESGGQSKATQVTESSAEAASDSDSQAQMMKEAAKMMVDQLNEQVSDGSIEVEALGQQLVIRIKENASFPAGSAFLQPKFWPVVRKIATLLKDVPGEITVSGHTDSGIVHNELFQNNWDLSVQRALAVANQMLMVQDFDHNRLIIQGLADTQPRVPNNTVANRRQNRRVEITVAQGKPKYSQPIEAGNAP
ncbi:flagellar motor protein MotB [Pseudaeromonas paramecii]|uniref:Flagellar motor protein MotB n=1 Tax=Pseudaeromonas paramecii TaxID=2138166 RepID=A0ABP8QBU4_9GAMM